MRLHAGRRIQRNSLILMVIFLGFAFVFIKMSEKSFRIDLHEHIAIELEMFVKTESNEFFSKITSPSHPHCVFFRQRFPMMKEPDGDMDIAFTMVIHKDAYQIARLLRMIHRTNNYYCVHLDARSEESFVGAIEGIARCYGSNVELVPSEKRVAVTWGDESVLRPQLICGEQVLARHATWKYLVNIVGQEFPLRTNLELVADFKALNGSNLVESFSIDEFRRRVGNAELPLNVNRIFAYFHKENDNAKLSISNIKSKVDSKGCSSGSFILS